MRDEVELCPPPGYRVTGILATRPGLRVLEAHWEGDQRVVLRLEAAGAETAAELEVLAAVEHPGLARLVDHGPLPGGGRYLARAWVEGTPLDRLVGKRRPKELGRILARTAQVVEHLHGAGFVHGDLKAANIIVAAGDHPILVDFGLAHREEEHRSTGGSWFHLAPEVLLGAPRGRSADIFALGVTLASLLAPFPVDARSFHGAFPARPFLEAAGVDPSQLPAWAREIIVGATDRDPACRPPSAGWIAETLGARLGGVRRASLAPLQLTWPLLEGRTHFVEARSRRLESLGERFEVWTFDDAQEAARIGRAAALHLALRDPAVRGIDLGRTRACATTAELDTWARAVTRGEGLRIVYGGGGGWGDRAAAALLAAGGQHHGSRWILCTAGTPPTGLPTRPFPPLSEQAVLARLRAWLPDTDDDALTLLGERIHAECHGSAVRAETLIQAVADAGWLHLDHRGLRLREGRLPDHLGRSLAAPATSPTARLDGNARRLLAALVILEQPALPSEVRVLTGLSAGALAEAAADARRSGALRLEEGRWSAARPLPRRKALALSLDDWRALHAVHARGLEGDERLLALALASGGEESDALRERIVSLRDHGLPECAVAWLSRLVSQLRLAQEEVPVWVRGELALTWSRVGDTDQVERHVRNLEDEESPEAQGYIYRARARLASMRQRYGEAHELYRRAAALDPGCAEEAHLARARLAFETGDGETLEELASNCDRFARPVALDLGALAAMHAAQCGRVDQARASFERSLTETLERGESGHRPVLLYNLALLERRAGNLERSLELLEEALAGYEELGDLVGAARTLLALGTARRQAGDLVASHAHLIEATSMRERLGDHLGAQRARGVLGLGLAERGHLRQAADALAESARSLAEAGAAADALRLEARRTELLVRMGHEPNPPSIECDPAARLCLVRTAWLQGDPQEARRLALLVRDEAAKLGQASEEAQAEWLLARIDGRSIEAQGLTARLAEEERLLATLAGELRPGPALAQVRALIGRGRDDRAARLAIAIVARTTDAQARASAAALARETLGRASVGMDASEREAFIEHLLDIPDPFPSDLDHWRENGSPEDDMDLLNLLELNQRLVDQQDLPQLLGAIVESALEVTGAERGFLVLEEEGELHLDHAMDSIRGDLEAEDIEVSQTVLTEALASGSVLRVSNAAAHPVLSAAPSVTELELRSILCCPFDVHPGLRGVVYVDHRVKEGAFDDRAERLLTLLAGQAALAIRQVRRLEEIRRLNSELEERVVTRETDLRAAKRILARSGLTVPIDGLIGESQPMRAVHELIRRIAPADISVLVCGESGTGKELVARALHDLSPRREGPFVSENCAALPASIIESELFGHAKGAYTGAHADRAGLFERASGGTLFLDEIGELPIDLQAKLLRVLETREVRRVGSEALIPVDFRLVAATNRDLSAEVAADRFRGDLLYRLDGVRIELPPLAQRLDDLPLLVDHFLRLQATKDGVRRKASRNVLRALSEREWPGNVRELANEVARLCVLSEGDLDDPSLVRQSSLATSVSRGGPILPLAQLEKQAILDAVERTGGDKRRAAELLGISRAKIYQRLKEWGLSSK